jgi:SAM-dependent methyltransferase
MITTTQPIPRYHTGEDLQERLLDALQRNGKNTRSLTRDDLASITEFHPGRREATRDLARVAGLRHFMEVLDVGCGVGGPARTLAAEFGCRVTGIDTREEYIGVARELSDRVGMGGQVAFRRGNAVDLPFPDASFDAVWVQHTVASVEDKPALFLEARRVLRPGGRLALCDACAGSKFSRALPGSMGRAWHRMLPDPARGNARDRRACRVRDVHLRRPLGRYAALRPPGARSRRVPAQRSSAAGIESAGRPCR